MITALLLLLTVTSAAQERMAPSAGSGGQFQISGTVVNASNDQPLAGADVTITAVQGAAGRIVQTGADGAFRFDGVPAGKYALSAERHGFASQHYQQHEGFSTAIVVGPGLDSDNIVFRAVPDASFSGRIADEQGDAVRNALVALIYDQIVEGRATKTQMGIVPTDDQGRYHFAHLKPGEYYLVVSARPWYTEPRFMGRMGFGGRGGPMAAGTAGNPALDVAYPLTFYPDVTDSSAARPIRLQAGDHASADITVRAVPALHVRIVNIGGEPKGEEPRRFAGASLSQTIFDDVEVSIPTMARPIAANELMITGCAPGHYLLRVMPNARGFGPKQEPPDGEEAPQPVRVREVELVSDTELDASEMPASVAVSGTIKSANGQPLARPPQLQLRTSTIHRGYGTLVSQNGEFTFSRGIPAGRYEIAMSGSESTFIRNVSATGAKVTGRTVQLGGSDTAQLTVIAASGTARVEGVALRDGKPLAGAMILLAPQDAQNNLPLFRRDQSDSDGSFTLSNVVPGRYTLLALENGWDLAWSDASVLKPLLAGGETLVVERKGNYNVRVKVQ